MEKKALINVDYTIDFVTGALPAGQPAVEIEEKVASLTEQFLANGDFVVLAIDLHTENDPYHPETKLFPPHNIEGTEGRRLYGKLEDVYQAYKDSANLYYMNKTRYSAFAGTDLDIKLKERGITELHIVGVCTDICILHTAVDAYNKGYSIVIHQNATASFNQAGHEWALLHFQDCLAANVI
ncbi:cysteine hydrolase family protein [Bacillus thermotolerans]|uniref:Nicotinamidase n=1 Tax=Bacillus thermotolerans TaxID=1221996 RepID=A0A0F5IC28_BACTR|nr:isochorismatase family cysteine hydrolase [Bacillus thermotolerans]KKB39107.1 Nicotinamidase [Bacillus thermotolerans]KKB42727.1 Nicotinamidase [Bacillus thermotolerans]